MQIKHFTIAVLLLAASILFTAPAFAQPSGAYDAYLIQNLTAYADTLTFTPNQGTPHEGTVTSNQLGAGEFHYSSAEQMVVIVFGVHPFSTPNFAMAGKLVGNQWQGVLTVANTSGAVWVAQKGAFTPNPSDFGSAIAIGKESSDPQGKVYTGYEWNPYIVGLSFKLTNGVSGAGLVEDFFSGTSPGSHGHYASSTYTSSNDQLMVMTLPGNRVYGAVVTDLGSDSIKLQGAWFNASSNAAGTFQVFH